MEVLIVLGILALIALFFLGLPLLILRFILSKFLPQRRQKIANLVLLFLFTIGCVCIFYIHIQETRYAVQIPGYRVEFYEPMDVFYFDIPPYFLIYQEDGRKAEFQIDVDASRCLGLHTQTQGSRIYFRCFGEPIEKASYVDKKDLIVFSGWYQKGSPIQDLNFVGEFK